MKDIKFIKKVIGEFDNSIGKGMMNTFSTVGDINNDGKLDFAISGRNGKMAWLENKGKSDNWDIHIIDDVKNLECGGCLFDITGTGNLDIINGGDWQSDEIYWWENPGRNDVNWTKRTIAKTGHGQFHDTLIGDVTNNGVKSLIFTNQIDGTNICMIPIPENPYVSPWPGFEIIASSMKEKNPYRLDGEQPEEGLAIGDVDGDGKNEIVCGTHWYKRVDHNWEAYKFAEGYITTKVVITDIDGDGKNEIILSEGDPCVYGKVQGGKLAWFKPSENIHELWQENIIEDNLIDPHSLQVGDITGNGKMDIFVGEVGMADNVTDEYINRLPRLIIFENKGEGKFIPHIIDEGTGTHEALLVDLRNTGKLDIIGKPLHGPEKWKIHIWVNSN